jgi:hypothetical protein
MRRTNHKPALMLLIACFAVAVASLPASVGLFKLTFSGRISDEHFAMFFFIACCLAVLGFVAGIMTIPVFFEWGNLFLTSMEERGEISNGKPEVDVQIVYVRQGNTYIPVRVSADDVIPVERRLR